MQALMSTTAAPVAPSPVVHLGKKDTRLSVTLYSGLAPAEAAWRQLEELGEATPYQRYDWVRAFSQAGFTANGDISVLLLQQEDQPVALLPFTITRRFGIRIAHLVGMSISNGDAMLFDPAFRDRLDKPTLRQAFATLPADLVNFHCVSARADGKENPLLSFPHTPAPDHFFFNELAGGDTPYIEQSLPHKRRTNIKRSRRRLAEGFGEVRLEVARSEQEIDLMIEAFLDQRGKRFKQMGVENVFATPAFRTFFRRLAIEGLGMDRPCLRIHSLYAGDRIVATSIGTYGRNHYSQYINSTDYGEASRYSLMGVTLSLLIDELRGAGITSIDMGLGDFDYKLDWTRSMTVYDVVIANSHVGKLAAPLLRTARGVKRTIKQTPWLWWCARQLRTLKTRLSNPGN